MNRLLTAVLAFLAVTLIGVSQAPAATIIQIDLPQLVAQSDLIATGEVTDTDEQFDDERGRVYTTITIEIDDVVDGKPTDEVVLRHPGGQDGDIATHAPGVPHFTDDERVFLFLQHTDEHAALVGLSQGVFRISIGPDGETDFVIPRVHGGHLIPPDQAPPFKPDSDAEGLPDFDPESHQDIYQRVHRYESFRHRVEQTVEELSPPEESE